MADYQDCPDYLQEFLFYMLTIRGRSKRTVDAYYIDLRTFLRYIKCTKHLSDDLKNDPEAFQQISIQDVSLETSPTDFFSRRISIPYLYNGSARKQCKNSFQKSFVHPRYVPVSYNKNQ